MRETAHVREVGLRDGLQMVKRSCHRPQARLVPGRGGAGIREIEVTSFVPAKIVPQFGDADEVAERTGSSAASGFALVPNLKGAERGFDIGVRKMNYVLSASETHNLANVRRSTDELARGLPAYRPGAGGSRLRKVLLGAGVATAFGCTIEGDVTRAASSSSSTACWKRCRRDHGRRHRRLRRSGKVRRLIAGSSSAAAISR